MRGGGKPAACENAALSLLLLVLLLVSPIAAKRRDARMSDTVSAACRPTRVHFRSPTGRRNSLLRRRVRRTSDRPAKYARYGCRECAKAEIVEAPSVPNQKSCVTSGSRQHGDASAPNSTDSHVEAGSRICQLDLLERAACASVVPRQQLGGETARCAPAASALPLSGRHDMTTGPGLTCWHNSIPTSSKAGKLVNVRSSHARTPHMLLQHAAPAARH